MKLIYKDKEYDITWIEISSTYGGQIEIDSYDYITDKNIRLQIPLDAIIQIKERETVEEKECFNERMFLAERMILEKHEDFMDELEEMEGNVNDLMDSVSKHECSQCEFLGNPCAGHDICPLYDFEDREIDDSRTKEE